MQRSQCRRILPLATMGQAPVPEDVYHNELQVLRVPYGETLLQKLQPPLSYSPFQL
jgi:hypothetical protein